MRPTVLSVAVLPPFLTDRLREAFDFHDRTHERDAAAFRALAPKVRALAASGEAKVTRELLAQMPAVELISVFGVGYDGIDLPAVRERGVKVSNTPDVLTDDVADLAMGLIIAAARELLAADSYLRGGHWAKGPFRLTRKVSGARLGIIGLGRIGSALARRAEAFGMKISYTDRAPIAGTTYAFHPNPAALASHVDFLVVAAYGGPTTRGLVDAKVLEALGPEGILINVARGSVVDEPALVAALRAGRIRGAGLDVFANEPNVPAELVAMENVVLTPHVASGTLQTRKAMADLAFANLEAHFAGKPLVTPIPG
ncbi:MAG TPA: 2-hydroxyacid dehydrogenase [Burkholderiaceae bacterium]|nr:2-hydroxyacid dehydrogenase [Burkholderiaceae bacterium]